MKQEPEIEPWEVRGYPWSVWLAAIIWILFGAINLLFGSIRIFAAMLLSERKFEAADQVDLGSSVVLGSIMSVFGIRTLQGSSQSVKTAAIFSIVLSILYYVASAVGRSEPCCFGVLGVVLTCSGLAALFGTRDYAIWRKSNEETDRFLHAPKSDSRIRWKWD